ncbi:spore germination protein [Alteribacillus iranensis]|uniref:Spore germination protein KA n=1 Tax=Alteribacillus iranensis TaxID=930128 RepID=A0A1I2DK16_9BACI|nr:spore germination protein [Alteribacillus iranensis]SFE80807.1 spore germination protein KA [Alteribacillus iranensis]
MLFRKAKKNRKLNSKQGADKASSTSAPPFGEKEVVENLDEMIELIFQLLGENADFVTRELTIFGEYRAAVFFMSSLVDQAEIHQQIMKPLMILPDDLSFDEILQTDIIPIIANESLYHSEVSLESSTAALVDAILIGETVVVIEGKRQAFRIDTRNIAKRSVTAPETEQVIIGPREGFIEQIETNMGLLRYRLPNRAFCIKTTKLGKLTKTTVAICYVKGVTNQKIVQEVEQRLSQIDIDATLDVGTIEQFIEDNSFSPFPQTYLAERPDSTIGNLMEGRVAILVDGSPFALLVPVVFNQFYQTMEDYTSRFLLGSFTRVIRVLALVFSIVVPSLYVSLISFNPELFPTQFAVAVAGGRAGVPFPAVIEVLLLEGAMEVLREATIRLPTQIGSALSIVGVLIIGQAAVEAGFSSPITIVVIALTTISSFATPVYSASFAFRILRFPLIILAGRFGLYGVVIGILFIFNHMLSLRSFGVPYMSPVAPGNAQGMKDVVIRSPFQWMTKRPAFLHPLDRDRVGSKDE